MTGDWSHVALLTLGMVPFSACRKPEPPPAPAKVLVITPAQPTKVTHAGEGLRGGGYNYKPGISAEPAP